MKKTRHGKIARLPYVVREEVNRRLRGGAEGKRVVVWLNTLPEVRAILDEVFGGGVIREQNLSEWRKGGYRDWLEGEERLEFTVRLGEEGAKVAEDQIWQIIAYLRTLGTNGEPVKPPTPSQGP